MSESTPSVPRRPKKAETSEKAEPVEPSSIVTRIPDEAISPAEVISDRVESELNVSSRDHESDKDSSEVDSEATNPTSNSRAGDSFPLPAIPARPKRKTKSSDSGSYHVEPERPDSVQQYVQEGTHEENNIDQSKLNSEVDALNVGNDLDEDGELTPGNSKTKVTFKSEDASLEGSQEGSGFDDDVETVMQEKEDLLNTEITPAPQESSSVQSSESVELDNAPVTEASQPDIEIIENELKDEKELPGGDNVSEQIEIVDPIETSKTKVDSISEIATREENITDKPTESNFIPIIPKRPRKSETDKFSSSDNAESSQVALPSVPSRPKKKVLVPIQAKKEGNVVEENQTSGPDKEEEDQPNPDAQDDEKPKIKAPPPKPKKLSSKIAAFQQMFNQEAPKKEVTKREPPSLSFSNKLSSDKMKFAESLRGVMGKGIPMPGMVNPNLKKDDVSEEAKSSAKEEVLLPKPITQERRTKGPKGKRLPKSLNDPIKVESRSRFTLVSHDLWDINYSKNNQSNAEHQRLANSIHPSEDVASISQPIQRSEIIETFDSISNEARDSGMESKQVEGIGRSEVDRIQSEQIVEPPVEPHKESEFSTTLAEMETGSIVGTQDVSEAFQLSDERDSNTTTLE